MTQVLKNHYTVADYLALEEKSEIKHEYYQGQINEMEGATLNHNRITGNLTGWLNNRFWNEQRFCEAFSSLIRLKVADNFYTYPDVTVVDGKIETIKGRDDTVTNTIVIFEVLSPSTSFHDRNRKFTRYKKIDSLRYYIWIEQDTPSVTCNELVDGKWVGTHYDDMSQAVEIAALNLRIPLTEIYKRVEFPDENV